MREDDDLKRATELSLQGLNFHQIYCLQFKKLHNNAIKDLGAVR